MLRTLYPLFICSAVVSAVKVNISESFSIDARGKLESAQILTTPDRGVRYFEANCGNEAAALVICALLDGVHQAGYLVSSQWAGKPGEGMLTVDLRVPNGRYLYGEIASESRVPIFWVLEPQVRFLVRPGPGDTHTEVAIQGLYAMPPAQGVDLYEKFMVEAGLMTIVEPSSPEEQREVSIQRTTDAQVIAAAGKYLENHFWKNKTDIPIREQQGKLSAILLTSYDKMKMRVTVGSQWHMVFFQLCLVVPLRYTSFVFFGGAKGADKMYFTTEELVTSDRRYQLYGFKEQSERAGLQALLNAKSTMAVAEMAARSGINFGKSMSYGNAAARETMTSVGISAGSPDAIANLVSFCQGTSEGQDPACHKKQPGRVGWGLIPSVRMGRGLELPPEEEAVDLQDA